MPDDVAKEILQRLNTLAYALDNGSGNDELIPMKEFMARTGQGETPAREAYKSKKLARAGILVKTTPPDKIGGWRINWKKYMKYAANNAADALRIVV